jgi:hypothetical protein
MDPQSCQSMEYEDNLAKIQRDDKYNLFFCLLFPRFSCSWSELRVALNWTTIICHQLALLQRVEVSLQEVGQDFRLRGVQVVQVVLVDSLVQMCLSIKVELDPVKDLPLLDQMPLHLQDPTHQLLHSQAVHQSKLSPTKMLTTEMEAINGGKDMKFVVLPRKNGIKVQ